MKNKKFLSIFVSFMAVLVFACFISGCSLQKDKNISSIQVIQSTIPEQIVVGQFDNAQIQAQVNYEDGTYEILNITSALLKDSQKEKLNTPGTYTIEILFRGVSTSITITMVQATQSYVVKFYNGKNELISVQVVEEGQDAIAPSEALYEIDGYEFIGWDRIFTDISGDINVYGVYVKVIEKNEEDYSEELFKAVDKMTETTLNISSITPSGYRYDTTLFYQDGIYDKAVIKRTVNGTVEYYDKFVKDTSNSQEITYSLSRFDSSGETVMSIADYYFNQYDIYEQVKEILTSASELTYSKSSTLGLEYYTLLAKAVPNDGPNYKEYEFEFSSSQIISIKRYDIDSTEERSLAETLYYIVNPEQVVVYPADIELLSIAENVYKHDVVITTREATDILLVAKVITNDADNNAACIEENDTTTYMWDKNDATYYTSEELTDTYTPYVYKTTASEKRYGNEFYYMVKNLTVTPSLILMDNGSVQFTYVVEDSSSSQGYTLRIAVADGKLAAITKYDGADQEVVFTMDFEYQETEVIVPTKLVECEANAIEI
ncbi:MAG: hypothetical protein E7376_04435 [Clostridiales bacterium]|nr:hypothetical protein [Clostridiales bacterium]